MHESDPLDSAIADARALRDSAENVEQGKLVAARACAARLRDAVDAFLGRTELERVARQELRWSVQERVERPWYRGGPTTRLGWQSLRVLVLRDHVSSMGSTSGTDGLYLDDSGRLLVLSQNTWQSAPAVIDPDRCAEPLVNEVIAAMGRVIVN